MPPLYLLGYNHSQQCTLQGSSMLQKAILIAQESDVSSLLACLTLPRGDLWMAPSLHPVIQGRILVVPFVTHFQH